MGRFICEAIPYNGFKERIKICKELQRKRMRFSIEGNIILFIRGGLTFSFFMRLKQKKEED